MRLEVGDQIDRYTLVARIGQGGQGEVWRVLDPLAPARPLALKILDLSSASPVDMERARREAHALARLSHPALLICHALVEDLRHDVLCLVLDLVEGKPLAELLDSALPSPTQVQAIVQQLAAGLAYLHQEGLVHRDIKPDNVLITDLFWSAPTSPGAVKLIDFGISVDRGNPRPLTAVGNLIGTPPFLAPERIDPGFWRAPDDTPAIDVFALGVLGWLCLHGVHPAGLGLQESMPAFARAYRAIEQSEPVWPAVQRGDGLETVLRRCLSLRASERPAGGEDILLLLDTFAPGSSSMLPGPPRGSVVPASAPRSSMPSLAPLTGPVGAAGAASSMGSMGLFGSVGAVSSPGASSPGAMGAVEASGFPGAPRSPSSPGFPGAMGPLGPRHLSVTGQPSFAALPAVTGQPSYPALPPAPITLIDAPLRLPPTLIDAPPLAATALAPPLPLALSAPASLVPASVAPSTVPPTVELVLAEEPVMQLRTRAIVARTLLVLIALALLSVALLEAWRSTRPKPHHHPGQPGQTAPLHPHRPQPQPDPS